MYNYEKMPPYFYFGSCRNHLWEKFIGRDIINIVGIWCKYWVCVVADVRFLEKFSLVPDQPFLHVLMFFFLSLCLCAGVNVLLAPRWPVEEVSLTGGLHHTAATHRETVPPAGLSQQHNTGFHQSVTLQIRRQLSICLLIIWTPRS